MQTGKCMVVLNIVEIVGVKFSEHQVQDGSPIKVRSQILGGSRIICTQLVRRLQSKDLRYKDTRYTAHLCRRPRYLGINLLQNACMHSIAYNTIQ